MKFYKGDIVQRDKDENGNDLTCLWGANLVGVVSEVDTSKMFRLWYRPFKNRVKHLFWVIFKGK